MLNVGDVVTRVGFKYDERDADRFERKERELRQKSQRPIEQKVDVDTDRAVRDLDKYDRKVRDADDSHTRFARGSGRVRGALGSLFIGGAGVAAGGIAFAGLAKGVMSANSAFEDSQKVSRQTDAVLKSTGGAANVTAKEIEGLAGALSRKTGIDDEVIQSGQNMLLTFTNVRNEAGKGNDVFNQATRTITDMSAALGQDTKSSAIQLGKALNDPIKGVTALQRVGVTFTKQQKEQIAALVESGKTVQAQKLILGELNKEFGGSAAAQATWSDRLKVTWGNVQEAIGARLAPALEKAGKWVDGFMRDMLRGSGTAGRFASNIRSVAGGIRSALGAAFGFISRVVRDNRRTIDNLGRTFGRLLQDTRRIFRGIGNAISDVFGSGSGTGRDIRSIIRVLGTFVATIMRVFEAVVRRALPGIITAFRGLAEIVRGVIKVISGVLSGDFRKVWEGVKDIFGGAVKALGGIIRAGTAPIREAAAAVFNAVKDKIADLPGALLGIGKRAVSSLGKGLAGIPGAIVGAFKGGGSFLLGIGRGIADWLNDNTPFGDKVKVGPISVRLPALRRGGKAGPGEGGPAVVFGEGAKTEWWISQEGDRRTNIGWAVEALRELTGRNVVFARSGRRSKRKSPPKPVLKEGTNAGIKRSIARAGAGMKGFERDIQRMERQYDQKDREYGMSEEEFVTENDDGSATLNDEAVQQRLRELGSLHALRKRIKEKVQAYKDAVANAISTYERAISRLTRAIRAAKGSARGKERGGYLAQRAGYSTRVAELKDVARDLDLDLEDNRLDLLEIEGEGASVRGQTGRAAPDSGGTGGDTGGSGDSGGGETETGGETATAPPSAADIAAAAYADFQAFTGARAALFSSFGSNFMSREGLAAMLLGSAPATSQAAGLRAFGAVPGSGGTSIQITNNFGGGPAEPGTWAQQQRFAVESAMGA